ncbi:MAG: FtsW/RodA/SpoVE family cell cycle protein, partial [Patescibacteria group bacterium]
MSSSRVHRPDTILLVITGILLIIGLFMIASASPVMSSSRFGDAYFFLKNQVVGLGIGAAALLISMRIHYTFWKKIAPFLLIISLLLMVLVFVPGIGMTLKGASRWIHIGAITLQPAEILKFAFIAYLASWLVARQKDIKGFASGFIPFLVMLGIISVFFILQPDISTLGVLSISASLLYFSGGGKWSQIGILLLIGILAFGVIVFT